MRTFDFRRFVQLSAISGSVIIIGGFVAFLNLVVFEVGSSYIWLTAFGLCLLSPLLIYISARIFSRSECVKDQQSLISYAEYAAKLYKENNNRAIIPGIIYAFSFITWLFVQDVALIKTVMQVLFAISSAASLFFLISTHVVWFRYFYVSKKYMDQKSAEQLYRDGLEEVRRRRIKYQNYCAARRGVCDKSVRYQGKRSIFIAYQFSGESEDQMKELAHYLEDLDFIIKLPPGSEFAEALLCKLCQSILSCQNFVAEVVTSNQNVYFELGLAKGYEKRVWILAFGEIINAKALKHPLLAAVIRIQKERFDVKSIGSRIEGDFRSDIKAGIKPNDRRIPIKQFPSLARLASKTVLIIGPRLVDVGLKGEFQEYDKIGQVIRSCMRAYNLETKEYFDLTPGLNIGHVFEEITNARMVVGLLADEKFDDFLNVNCIISYLLGYALATETRLLTFQKLPCSKQMLDLYGFVHATKDAVDFEQKYSQLLRDAITYKIPNRIYPPPP